MEQTQNKDSQSRGFFQHLDFQKIKDLIETLMSQETRDDLKEGGQHIIMAKDKFMSVICRLKGWDEWLLEDDGSRDIDPVVEGAMTRILSSPDDFT